MPREMMMIERARAVSLVGECKTRKVSEVMECSMVDKGTSGAERSLQSPSLIKAQDA